MSGREMRPLSLSIGASLLPSFSLVSAANGPAADSGQDCHGKVCHAVSEYCSMFAESCMPCADICDASSHNYHADTCAKECSAYKSFDPLLDDIQNRVVPKLDQIRIVLFIILLLVFINYMVKFLRWLGVKRCLQRCMARLQSKTQPSNGKELNGMTIQNPNAFNRDIERAPSQIYSVAGAAEGSVLTMATPVSTRYPAENSTTPTTVVTEIGYGQGYDNQAMVTTPVAEKAVTATTSTTAGF
ncbi:protein grindelwald [Drosophila mojavensis]|uniref:Protein grindelwald n=1 Tax=Drosophila mojavensis TaxID=7230 RepID=B4KK32_DROMO|nr:protein grindelwald [Drosophila mojavensis]EDW11550.1 uncharacterized protein Dmoj_GI14131 [Drosophila mojavensis]